MSAPKVAVRQVPRQREVVSRRNVGGKDVFEANVGEDVVSRKRVVFGILFLEEALVSRTSVKETLEGRLFLGEASVVLVL